jgi:hypothetical protein
MKKPKALLLGIVLFFITSNAYAVKVVNYCMTDNLEKAVCGLHMPACKQLFDAETDYAMYLYYVLDEIQIGDQRKLIWYYENKIYFESEYETLSDEGYICYWRYYIIQGTPIEYMTGNWKVECWYNDELLFADDWYLEGSLPTICAAEYVIDDDATLNLMRKFRDEVLSKSELGMNLINLYYKLSPMVIEVIEDNPGVKEKLKIFLGVFIKKLED